MLLKERINADYIEAFKNKQTEKKNFLGVVKGEIQNEEFRSLGIGDDATVIGILKKIEKSLKQTNTTESLTELEYIKPYLPELMNEGQIRTIIQGFVDSGIKDTGRLMGSFNRDYKGKADNAIVSKIVKELVG